LVFDITNEASFFNLFKWIDQYNFYNDLPLKNIIIVGNKHDLEDQRKISRLEISKFCESMECDYVEISVLENQGIEDLMTRVVEKCMDLKILMEEEEKKSGDSKGSPSKKDKGIIHLGGS
jgi:GTPase SAR1 family protein